MLKIVLQFNVQFSQKKEAPVFYYAYFCTNANQSAAKDFPKTTDRKIEIRQPQ